MKTILFYWSKGADTRVKILRTIQRCNARGKGCYLNTIAASMDLSHVGIKKHLDLLIEEGYVKIINPGGKPVFLELSHRGRDVLDEFTHKAAPAKKP
jgi:predicted ArsR family transcriptional regulator